MKAKLAGFVLIASLSLAAAAQESAFFHFTPITNTDDPLLQNLGNQLTMEVASTPADDTVKFTFTNIGDLESSLTRVYVDDAPSDLFASFFISSTTPGVNFALNASPANLSGGANPLNSFFATDSAAALRPRFNNGVNDSAEAPGEFLTMTGILNTGKAFADVLTSLTSGGATNPNFLRFGLRVVNFDADNDARTDSFLTTGQAGTPPPIPEPSMYGMLLAGLGLMTAIARRKQSSQ